MFSVQGFVICEIKVAAFDLSIVCIGVGKCVVLLVKLNYLDKKSIHKISCSLQISEFSSKFSSFGVTFEGHITYFHSI